MRRRRAEPQLVKPDPRYESVEVAKFINRLMMCGKKTVAQQIVYQALDIVKEKSGRPSIEVFTEALRNATPLLQVKPRRVGGATYQIPVEVGAAKGQSQAISWLISAARARKGLPMRQKLAQELLDAVKREGAAVRRRDEVHKMAEANRAFAHYRW